MKKRSTVSYLLHTLPVTEVITQEIAKQMFLYDPETGVMYRRKAGGKLVAASPDTTYPYVRVGICGKQTFVHRVAWLYMTGKWPELEIDHINGDPKDNRWCNLREATREQNCQNRAINRNNSHGTMGVVAHQGGWRARITVSGKCHELGVFKNKELARQAYLAARMRLCPFSPAPRDNGLYVRQKKAA